MVSNERLRKTSQERALLLHLVIKFISKTKWAEKSLQDENASQGTLELHCSVMLRLSIPSILCA